MLRAARSCCQSCVDGFTRPFRACFGTIAMVFVLLVASAIFFIIFGYFIAVKPLLLINSAWMPARCTFTAPMALHRIVLPKSPDVWRVDAPVSVRARDGSLDPWEVIAHRWPGSEVQGEVHQSQVAEWWTSKLDLKATMTRPPTSNLLGQPCCSRYDFETPVGRGVPCWYSGSEPERVKLSDEPVAGLWALYVVVVFLAGTVGLALWGAALIFGHEDRGCCLEFSRAYKKLGWEDARNTIHRSSSHLFVLRSESYSGPHDAELRNGFLRKVYGIVCAQVLLISGVGLAFMYCDPLNEWALVHGAVTTWTLFPMAIAILLALGCLKNRYPQNYLLLLAFTLVTSVSIGTVLAVARYSGTEDLVLQAAVLTGVIFVSLTLFTLQSKVRFDFLGGGLSVALSALIVAGLMRFLFPSTQLMHTLYALAGCLVFSLYIIFDTYMIAERLGYDDYLVAAIELYLDVLNLFLFILRLLGSSRD
jgi:FtsH-binding integral membrane protein